MQLGYSLASDCSLNSLSHLASHTMCHQTTAHGVYEQLYQLLVLIDIYVFVVDMNNLRHVYLSVSCTK